MLNMSIWRETQTANKVKSVAPELRPLTKVVIGSSVAEPWLGTEQQQAGGDNIMHPES